MLQGAIKLFTIRGIEVRLDYSWFVIFILVTYSLAAQYFPAEYPGWPLLIYWTLGVATSLLFFVSVLLHELAHSFVAQAHGIRVPRITLFIFGGAAQIAEEPKSARDEFLMALAGPASSILIAVVSGLLWLLFRNALVIAPLAALFQWLAMINLTLAIFNLIPGFPLDGGRVLRAIVWGVTRDMGKSTRIAAGAGLVVAILFILLGLAQLLAGQYLNGVWIIFIGWFLIQAATSSTRQQALKDVLAGHVAGEVMWTDCPFIEASTLVSDLVYRQILHTGRRCFPVLENGRVSGIVTVHNIKAVPPEMWQATPAGQIMVPAQALKVVAPETPMNLVMEMLAGDGVNQVPVVKDGKFLGMVTREGVMEFLRTRSELGLR